MAPPGVPPNLVRLLDPLVLSVVGATAQLTLALALTVALAGARRALDYRAARWWVVAQASLSMALAAVLARNLIGPVPRAGDANVALHLLAGGYAAGKVAFFAALGLGTHERLGRPVPPRLVQATVLAILAAAGAVTLLTPSLGRVYLLQGAFGLVVMGVSAWRLHRADAALRTEGTRWLARALAFYAALSLPYVLGFRYQGVALPGDPLSLVRLLVDRSSVVDLLGQFLLGLAMLALLLDQRREVARRERDQRTALEHEAATTARLEAIGRVAATVAHELNNPLTVVVGTAEQLAASPIDEALRADLALIVREAMRCRHVARDLLLATRQEAPAHAPVAVATLLAHAADAVRLHASAAGVVVRAAGEHDVEILGDAVALEQAVINLARNAIDATPRGGTVTLRGAARRDEATIAVEDEGAGIAPAVRATLFAPLRTTKAPGAGAGLGLSIVRGIVQRHGGTIEVHGAPERAVGTAFVLRLPRHVAAVEALAPRPAVEATAAPAAPPPAHPAHPGAPAAPVALVIDDEAGIRAVLRRALERAGYTVAEARDGLEAQLALTDGLGSRLAVVFCDVRMPRVDGVQLLRWMREAAPELLGRTVLLTGDTVSDEVRDIVSETGCHLLAKPFALADVTRTLGRLSAA